LKRKVLLTFLGAVALAGVVVAPVAYAANGAVQSSNCNTPQNFPVVMCSYPAGASWSITAAVTQSTQATANVAAATGVQHCLTELEAVAYATASAPTATGVIIQVYDGTNGGTLLWNGAISLVATAGTSSQLE